MSLQVLLLVLWSSAALGIGVLLGALAERAAGRRREMERRARVTMTWTPPPDHPNCRCTVVDVENFS